MDKVKVLAFHLPQYHKFVENDEWWGEGFTDWVNVRKARKYFKEHNQPRIPLNDNYYDMTDINTFYFQSELAEKYGIYGFCYYHYWFRGRLLMEKPLELMLEHKEIELRYCLCWANEPWTRSWDGETGTVLIGQEYGNEKDWEEHFRYLLPFFKDDRYITSDGKPVFIIYKATEIKCLNEMIGYFNKRANEEGLRGIRIIEEINSGQKRKTCHLSDGALIFEPANTLFNERPFWEKVIQRIRSEYLNRINGNKIRYYPYDKIWRRLLMAYRQKGKEMDIYPGCFVDWDNTARRGNNGMIVEGASPDRFRVYFSKLLALAIKNGTEFLFINAWNEWAEGCYLEPDKAYGYGYLETVRSVMDEQCGGGTL